MTSLTDKRWKSIIKKDKTQHYETKDTLFLLVFWFWSSLRISVSCWQKTQSFICWISAPRSSAAGDEIKYWHVSLPSLEAKCPIYVISLRLSTPCLNGRWLNYLNAMHRYYFCNGIQKWKRAVLLWKILSYKPKCIGESITRALQRLMRPQVKDSWN